MKNIIQILAFLMVFSCSSGQKTNNQPISNFNLDKYLGKWYEIARYDHSFEKNCQKVSAEYSLIKDNKVKVVNRCEIKNKEKIANGQAYFKYSPDIAHLRVSFFWPFYGDYKVIYIDKNYQNAIIDGGTYDYFWILSRKKKLDKKTMSKLLKKAKEFGYKKEKMIFPKQ